MKICQTILLLAAVGALPACGGSSPSTPTPTPTPDPKPVQLAQFTDSGVTTSDVRDVDRQIVQFDTNNGTLIWKATNQSFRGYTVNGNIINSSFQVRFGTEGGERRAYFTEAARPFLCNIEVANGQVTITPTNEPVPGGA